MSWGLGYLRYLNYKVIILIVIVISCIIGCYSIYIVVDGFDES